MTSVAPRIVNHVSDVTRINDKCHFSRQAQYIGEVELSLFVAGALFGEVQVSLSVAGAIFR